MGHGTGQCNKTHSHNTIKTLYSVIVKPTGNYTTMCIASLMISLGLVSD